LNFSDNESNEGAAKQEAPTHKGVPPAPVRNANLPWITSETDGAWDISVSI